MINSANEKMLIIVDSPKGLGKKNKKIEKKVLKFLVLENKVEVHFLW